MSTLAKIVLMAALSSLIGCSTMRDDVERRLADPAGMNHAEMEVFYATDRAPVTSAQEYFGPARGTLTYGAVKVSIPRDHRMGRLESPSLIRFEFKADPDKHVVVKSAERLSGEDFAVRLRAAVASAKSRSALLFVHGYNCTFVDAARRTAQLSYDLGFEGISAFYSWPSSGSIALYTTDEGNVEWTTTNLVRFLAGFVEASSAERIVLIGHSMGTRALTRAYIELLRDRPQLASRIVEIILAAPDIDAAVFARDLAPAMVQGGSAITLYASENDVPLKASRGVHGYVRAGDTKPSVLVTPGIETVDASFVESDFLAHSYFAHNRSLIADIFQIVRNRTRAANRAGLEPVAAGGKYWKFRP